VRYTAWLNATPEPPQGAGGTNAKRERARRLDFLEVLERIPSPDVPEGMYLADILFAIGPTRGDGPLYEEHLQPWETRRGIELDPWQADIILELSRAYLSESHAAREYNALSPWPPARNMWKYVRDQLNGAGLRAALQDSVKGQDHGNRKRR
jgi:hypothetical protein